MSVAWVGTLPDNVPLPVPISRTHTIQRLWDDPRYFKDWDEDRRLCDVTPIPFFPDDLPILRPDDFGWTALELETALDRARLVRGAT